MRQIRFVGALAISGGVALSGISCGSDPIVVVGPPPTGAPPEGAPTPEAPEAPEAPHVPAAEPQARVLFVMKRQRDDLEALVLSIAKPKSPEYGQYWSVEQVATTYGGSAQTIDQIIEYLDDAVGVSAKADPSGTFVHGLFTEAQATAVFGADLDAAPAVPPGLTDYVSGVLANFKAFDVPPPSSSRARSTHRSSGADELLNFPPWSRSSGTPGACPSEEPTDCQSPAAPSGTAEEFVAFSPPQLRTAYGVDRTGLAGAGKTAVIYITEGRPLLSDIQGYADGYGFDMPRISILGFDDPHIDEGGNGEVTLDVQSLVMMAPELDQISVFIGQQAHVYFPLAFSTALDPLHTGGKLPDVLSTSDSLCEIAVASIQNPLTYVAAMTNIIATLAAVGVTVVAAAGDQGSTCVDPLENGTPVYANYPASSGLVLAVGGTNLRLHPDNSIADAQVWNDWALVQSTPTDPCTSSPCRPLPTWAGGGGLSAVAPRPDWQEPVNPSNFRSLPDVSLYADIFPGGMMYINGQWENNANGTSFAAPMMAGLVVLMNEHLESHGQPRVGAVAPLLYALGNEAPAVFWDVVEGNNRPGDQTVQFDFDCCDATPGYDMASGWGSPILPDVLTALEKPVVALQIDDPSPSAEQTVTFTANTVVPGGSAHAFDWDFDGDGENDHTSTGPSTEHTYGTAGVHTPSVTLRTTLGRSSSASRSIIVTP